jgi:hypothetical protein
MPNGIDPPEENALSKTRGQETQEEPFIKRFEEKILSYAEAAEAGNMEEAEMAAMQALFMAAEDAIKNPTPSLVLKQEAAEHEDKGEWTEAETSRRKVLAIEEASGNFGLIAKAQMELSGTLRIVGRLAEAWQLAEAATASARRTKCFPVVVMALQNQVSCALERGEIADALPAGSEMVQVIEPGKLYDSMRSKALIYRAKCRVANKDLSEAEADLDSSWKLLNGLSVPKRLLGPRAALALWWEVKSRLLEAQGALRKARKAIAKVIEISREIDGPFPRFALARALERQGDLARQSGDLAAAEQAFTEARSIREELRLPALAPDPG